MNGRACDLGEVAALADALKSKPASCDVVVCPPSTLLDRMAGQYRGGVIGFGGQNCHTAINGAHTGDVSAEMLADCGAAFVIVGHSERRAGYGETDAAVAAKAEAGHRAGLIAIVCVGETLAERDSGAAIDVVVRQVEGSVPAGSTPSNTVIAYEPVWAIGTGRTPSNDDIALVHAAIRGRLSARFGEAGRQFRILYGGSVKPANAHEILGLENVNGALVGGASLKADEFKAIINTYGE